MKHPQFQQILQEASNGWDLVIASPFLNEAGVMLANHFKAPMILYLPANAGSFLSLSLGHPDRSLSNNYFHLHVLLNLIIIFCSFQRCLVWGDGRIPNWKDQHVIWAHGLRAGGQAILLRATSGMTWIRIFKRLASSNNKMLNHTQCFL